MAKIETEEYGAYNKDVVEAARKDLVGDRYVSHLSAFFKVLGDDTRVKIIYMLSGREMCVNDIAVALGASQSAVSHQLRQLKMTGQVKARRDGKNIYYSLDDHHVMGILEEAMEHIHHKVQDGQL